MEMEEPSKSNGQAGMRRFLANCNDTSMRTKYTLTKGSLTSQLVHLVVCEAVEVHNRITHDCEWEGGRVEQIQETEMKK